MSLCPHRKIINWKFPSINQTSATESQNLLKFTVRNDRPSKIITYRLPIIVLLASLTVANIIQNIEQVKNYDIDASHHGILLILVVGIVLLLCLQTLKTPNRDERYRYSIAK